MSMHVHFIIYRFVDHVLNKMLEYNNVHDIAYPFTSFTCFTVCFFLLVHVFVYSQTEFMSCDKRYNQ